jgi:hypothetical protein
MDASKKQDFDLTTIMEYLERLFPGQFLISAISAGIVLSYAQQTTRNMICAGTFPIPTQKLYGKRLAKKVDLADLLREMGQITKKKRGRPCKSAPRKPVGAEK